MPAPRGGTFGHPPASLKGKMTVSTSSMSGSDLSSPIGVSVEYFRSTDGTPIFMVEAPSPIPFGVNPPMHRDVWHPLIRPYERVVHQGKPDVGSVQYHLVHLPGDAGPRVLYSTAIRTGSRYQSKPLLPGSLHIFPGFASDRTHHRDGTELRVHHMTVRETSGGRIHTYTRGEPVREGDEAPPREPRAKVDGQPPIVHVGQLWIKDRNALANAGVAWTHMTPGSVKSMERRDYLLPDPVIKNHGLHNIKYDEGILSRPNHLWIGLFLAKEFPSDEEHQQILHFFHHLVPQHGRRHVDVDGEFDGSVLTRQVGVDIAGDVDCEYPFLLTIVGVVPGHMKYESGLAAFTHPIPLHEMYLQASP